MPGSLHWSLSLRYPYQNPVLASSLPHTHYMPRQSHSYRFYTHTTVSEEYRSLRSSLCSIVVWVTDWIQSFS
jgi:predicted phosphohydrolase